MYWCKNLIDSSSIENSQNLKKCYFSAARQHLGNDLKHNSQF